MLRGICRPESLLLPHFTRRACATWPRWTQCNGSRCPALLAWSVGLPHVLLIGAGLLLAAAIGLASGTGRKAGMLIWVVFIAAGWKPELAAQLALAALHAPLTPLLALLLAALILQAGAAPTAANRATPSQNARRWKAPGWAA